MDQIKKFYITSFLKNQTYFTPILILFFKNSSLDYVQIFWVFTIGSILSFFIEVPTGIFADLFGKRRSIIISKFGIFISFLTFGFSSSFWMFIIAQALFEIGNSFRSGTETAYVYDFLLQNNHFPNYTEVKGKQKFYARVGESLATSLGGLIAVSLGYNVVFFIAAIPAFINFILALSWQEIEEKKGIGVTFRSSYNLAKNSLLEIFRNKDLYKIILNILLFTSVVAALEKFIQPYMIDSNIPIAFFGIIYSISLILTAVSVRYSYIFENRFGSKNTINGLSILTIIPILILGLRFISFIGVIFFFLIVFVENIRSPVVNNQFHLNVESNRRATEGSILALVKSLGKILILPLAGYLANSFSIYFTILILGAILILNSFVFYI